MTDEQLIDKIILEWSWRCEKGYPDLSNEADLQLLENLFGIDLAEGKGFENLGPEAKDLANFFMREFSLPEESFKYVNKRKFSIITPEGIRRQELIRQIEGFAKDLDLVFDRSLKGSSIGGYKQLSTGVEVLFKDSVTAKMGAAGKENEAFLRDRVNAIATQETPITVLIKAEYNGKTLTYSNIVQAVDVSKKDERSGVKSDVNLIDSSGKVHGISVKKDGPFRWASVMSSHKEVFQTFLEKASRGEIDKLEIVQDPSNPRALNMKNPDNNKNYGKVYLINVPNVDIEQMAFGTDDANVVQRTFSDSDFSSKETSLEVNVSKIYETVDDFKGEDLPVLRLEKNESAATRREGVLRRGLTIRAVPVSEMREGSRANVLVVDYSKI